MAIAFDSVSPDTSSGAGVSSLTSANWTIAGTDRCVFGGIGTGDVTGANPTGMKWQGSAGTALTQIGATLSLGTHGKLSVWKLPAPAAATAASFGNWAASQGEATIGMVSYTGVDQTTPAGTSVTALCSSNGVGAARATVNVTTVAGDVVLAYAFWHNTSSATNPTATEVSPSTNRYYVPGTAIGGFATIMCIEQTASGTTTTMAVDFAACDLNLSNGGGIIAFVVNAAEAGGGAAVHSDIGQTRNRPGRGPRSLGRFFRPRIDAVTTPAASDAVANGQILPATSSLLSGGATAASTAPEATLTAISSLLAGAAAADSTAAGQTLSATASLIAGAVAAESTAAGQTLVATASLVPGSASGTGDATADGATLTATSSVVIGSATAASTADSVTLTTSISLVPGAAASNSAADGQVLAVTASLIVGAASGSSAGTAAGMTQIVAASLLAGGVAADAQALGALLAASASLIRGMVQGGFPAVPSEDLLYAVPGTSLLYVVPGRDLTHVLQ